MKAGADVATAEQQAVSSLVAAGFGPVDYVEVRRPGTLERLGPGPAEGPLRVLGAARLGRTRLIDNVGD